MRGIRFARGSGKSMLRMQRAIEEAAHAEVMMAGEPKRISVMDILAAAKEMCKFSIPASHMPEAPRPPDYSGNWCDPRQEEKKRRDRLARLNETMRRGSDG